MSVTKKLWDGNSNVTCYPEQSLNILKAFNEIINGLYHIGDEHKYIFHTLNTTSYVDAEYLKILNSIGCDLTDIANKLEMARSLLFGDCLNWNYVLENLKELSLKKDGVE